MPLRRAGTVPNAGAVLWRKRHKRNDRFRPTLARMPNEKGNRYAIHALKDRRATMAGEIVEFKQGIADREEQLSHLDATLRILDPSCRSDSIPPKKLRRVKLFGNGELNRLIADALRRAEKPLGSADIANCGDQGLRAGIDPCPDPAGAG
jgi:hypothetical protein